MVKIELLDTRIEIPFEDKEGNVVETLYFDRSDDSLQKLEKSIGVVEKKMKELEESESGWDTSKTFVKEAIDTVFGEGSFEKLYKISPSIQIIMHYFLQMAIGIRKQIADEQSEEKLKKYLG
ncbi:hypothetical protein [Enterococcus larvae]|uniref:hypothetical protein n=1 Tax=Enterococcus larvae TaxID=2794352 RepID=UPI003F31C549